MGTLLGDADSVSTFLRITFSQTEWHYRRLIARAFSVALIRTAFMVSEKSPLIDFISRYKTHVYILPLKHFSKRRFGIWITACSVTVCFFFSFRNAFSKKCYGTGLDKMRSEVIRKELEICGIQDVRLKYKQNWINHLERMDNTRLPKHALNYKPRGRRDRGRPRKRWQCVDAGTGQTT